jgi:hypothetical protein
MANITIGGATAKAWLDSGASQLIADPANFPGGGGDGTYIATDGNATTQHTIDMFDALDRDALNSGVFGIGVNNPFFTTEEGLTQYVAAHQFPGISSTPSEIGYYPDAVAGAQADTLDIKLDGPLYDAEANVSFFYGAEVTGGEQLTYELYLNGVKVGGETITSGNGLTYSSSEPGYYTFALDGFTGDVHVFDEVKFSGAPQTAFLDASDFLVENITGTTAEGLSAGYWKTHTSLWTDNDGLHNQVADGVTTDDLFTLYFAELPDGSVSKAVLADGVTLQEVLGLNGGGEWALARQAVAALLNINSDQIDAYPMTQIDLVDAVNAALAGNNAEATAALTNELNTYNTLETHWA